MTDSYDTAISLSPDLTIPDEFVDTAFRDEFSDELMVVHDAPYSYQLSSSVQSLQEGAGPTAIRVTATRVAGPIPAADLSIPLAFTDLTTTAADYTVTGTLAIPVQAGTVSGSTTLTFIPEDDGVPEVRTETVRIESASPHDFFLLGADLVVIDAPTITLSGSPGATIAEDGGAQSVTVTAELGDPGDAPRQRPITVTLTPSGTAGPGDYTIAENLAVTIAANARSGSATLTVTPVKRQAGWRATRRSCWQDGRRDSSSRGPPSSRCRTTRRAPQVILTVDPDTIGESDAAPTEVVVSAVLDPDVVLPNADTVVSLSLAGSATEGAGGDYTAEWDLPTPQITIPQGERTGSGTVALTLAPQQDQVAEGEETIVVEGTASTGTRR